MISKEEVLKNNQATDEQVIQRLQARIDERIKMFNGYNPIVVEIERGNEQRFVDSLRAMYISAGWKVVETTITKGSNPYNSHEVPALSFS
jgi:hypothetical protein